MILSQFTSKKGSTTDDVDLDEFGDDNEQDEDIEAEEEVDKDRMQSDEEEIDGIAKKVEAALKVPEKEVIAGRNALKKVSHF